MELSWSTFLLEVVNFVVLVWILKHFLYKPVLEVIDRRRQAIEQQLAEARQQHAQATSLQTQYQDRLAQWEQQQRQLKTALNQELEAEKGRQSGLLKEQLQKEQEEARSVIEHQQAEVIRQAELRALQQGAQFASRLLEAAAGPELETRLLTLTIDELSQMSDDTLERLRSQWGDEPAAMEVASAYPITDDHRHQLEHALRHRLKLNAPVKYRQDPELLAGLRISIGPWILNANVRDELNGFTELTYGAD